jgi:hypothetical protein
VLAEHRLVHRGRIVRPPQSRVGKTGRHNGGLSASGSEWPRCHYPIEGEPQRRHRPCDSPVGGRAFQGL